jgi:hypothetical protein
MSTAVHASPGRFSPASRARLTHYDLDRFPGDSLFDKMARAVCAAGCLPRKELFESWEVARRVRRLFRGGRVVDLAGGHGLLAHVMLLLDDTSPRAIVVDHTFPPSAAAIRDALLAAWPRLRDRVSCVASPIEDVELHDDDVVVSSHACGALTDTVLAKAVAARARVAVLPCCHHLERGDAGPLTGWIDLALATDVRRAVDLERHGYRVWTQRIPSTITPKHRLLLGAPLGAVAVAL